MKLTVIGSTLRNLAVIAVFAAGITMPLAGVVWGPRDNLLNEKRKLAECPELDRHIRTLKQFPEKFEAFFNDHFPYRDRLIRWNNLAKLRYLGISPHANVTLGRNQEWLFLTYEHAGNNPRKSRPFSPGELERCKQLIDTHVALAAKAGAKYILLITPDKQTVYPELYPRKRNIRYEQLLDYMHARSDVPFPDLRGPLSRAKAEHDVYYKTDSHWNEYGAHAAYMCVGEILRGWYPQIHLDPLSEFDTVETPTPPYAVCYYGDLPWLLGFGDLYKEHYSYLSLRHPRKAHKTDETIPIDEVNRLGGYYPYATEQNDPSLPTAVVFHDSFGARLAPLLSEHFRRVVFVPESVYDAAVVEREHPDVVIFEIVERKLEYICTPDPDPELP